MEQQRSHLEASRGRRSPVQERSRYLVSAILEATERLLGREGVGRASMRAIARLAGVSAGSLYQYFDSKDSLVASLVRERLLEDQKLLDDWYEEARGLPVDVGIANIMLHLVPEQEWKKDALLAMVEQLSITNRMDQLHSMMDAAADTLERYLREHPALGVGDPSPRARLLVHALRAAALEGMRVAPSPWDPRALRSELTVLALTMIESTIRESRPEKQTHSALSRQRHSGASRHG